MTVDLESLRGHTPGPWKFDKNLGCKTIRGGKSGPTKQAQYTELADTHGLNNEETDTANARLIAAAPALLAELTARRARDAEVEALVAAAKRTTDAFRALGESTPFTRHADRCHHECEQAMVALDAAILPLQRSDKGGETCPLPEHWRMAIKERGIENPKALDWIEQRARQMAKAGGDRGLPA